MQEKRENGLAQLDKWMALKNTYGPAIAGNNLSQTFIEERQLLLKTTQESKFITLMQRMKCYLGK